MHTNSQLCRALVNDDLDSFERYSDGSLFGVVTVAVLLFFIVVVLVRLVSMLSRIYVKVTVNVCGPKMSVFGF